MSSSTVTLPSELGYAFSGYFFRFYSFLVTVMGLIIPWSLTLAIVDIFSVFIKRPARQSGILSIVVLGDWVLSFLSLAASCSTASVSSLLLAAEGFCGRKLCTRYQLSAAMAFLSWFLSLSSSLFNLWLLPSVA
ncbi:CASP-like protein 5C1 isoform X2 [Andrographis paniculata]|uniref:CASP-like protein 5C1 isoform X2 n=1 Tax=Andrographis paniculata TaxID=175694 RepID=UPI0021E711C7|nr:CASP-like protein 5C1 isoform X2 [Andrographis paniculata]